MLGGACGNLNATAVVGCACTFKNTCDLLELAANFNHHLLSSASNGFHRESAEQERSHSTDESTYEYAGIHQVHLEVVHKGRDVLYLCKHLAHLCIASFSHAVYGFLYLLNVGCKQGQGSQRSRADCKALTCSGCGVAKGVEGVSAVAHFLSEFAHLGVTASIVGNGTVCICCQRDAQGGEHAHGGNTDTIKAVLDAFWIHIHLETICAKVAEHDGHANCQHGDACGNHTSSDTLDDNGGGACLTCSGNGLRGRIAVAGIVFRSLAYDDAGGKTADNAEGKTEPVLKAEAVKDCKRCACYEHCADVRTKRQAAEEILHRGAFLRANEEDADKTQEDTYGGDSHRSNDGVHLQWGSSECHGTQGCRAEDGAAVALIKVGAHTCNVAHVITNVVRDSCGVAGVVLWDVGFYLAHNVSTHVGGLRVDTTAHTGKQSLRGSTHTEGKHSRSDGNQAVVGKLAQNEEPDSDVEQAEADNSQTHHGTGAEGNLQASVKALAGCIGGTCAGVGCCLHTKEACQTGEETARQECKGHPGILHSQTVCHKCKKSSEYDEYDKYYLVLLLKISHCALTDVLGNFFHARCAFVGFQHALEEHPRHSKCHDRSDGHEPE